MPEMPAGRCKEFEAGVTTIASSPYNEHLLAVGRYVIWLLVIVLICEGPQANQI